LIQPLTLTYDLGALSPYISEKTMAAHYNRLYLNYVNKLNGKILEANISINYPLSNIFQNISVFPIYNYENNLMAKSFNIRDMYQFLLGVRVMNNTKLGDFARSVNLI